MDKSKGGKVGVAPSPRDPNSIDLNSSMTVTKRGNADNQNEGKKRQKRPSKHDNSCNSLNKVDIFGSEYRWNVEGQEVYKTTLGACCTLILLFWIIIFAIFVFKRAIVGSEFAPINEVVSKNYFNTDTHIRQKEEHFFFAVGVSSYANFDGQTVTDLIRNDLKFALEYRITGGPEDGKIFDIGVKNCTETDLNQLFDNDPAKNDIIKAHLDKEQFFCPNAFDMSFYGLQDSANRKHLSLKLQSKNTFKSNQYLNDKKLMLLVNQEEVSWNNTERQFQAVAKTGIYWLNSYIKMAQTTTINFQRTLVVNDHHPFLEMFGFSYKNEQYIELPESLIAHQPYHNLTDEATVTEITFQLNRDLKIVQKLNEGSSIMEAIALTGGLIVFGYVLLKAFFNIYVPWLMYAETVRLLFKVDPRKPKKPRSELRLAKKDPEELLKEAKENQNALVYLTSSVGDRLILTIESFVSTLFSCRANKFSRIVEDGSNQVKNELNILKFVRNAKFYASAFENLMNFNQRRLVNVQAKAALVLKPLAKEVTELGSIKKKNYEDDSDYTSEEDFDFIENLLKEDGKLDAMSLKMMRGVIQAPADERKREQKPGYVSKKKRNGKGGEDASFSDSVDVYGDEDGTMEHFRKEKNVVVAAPGSEMHALNPGADKGTAGEYIDADGYRRDKNGKLIRPKGMSEKEWKRMQREEELRRMQHLAHNFNYYAMDKDNV